MGAMSLDPDIFVDMETKNFRGSFGPPPFLPQMDVWDSVYTWARVGRLRTHRNL